LPLNFILPLLTVIVPFIVPFTTLPIVVDNPLTTTFPVMSPFNITGDPPKVVVATVNDP
jgi:hypothetical protein